MERLNFDYCTIATGNSVISSLKAAEKAIAKRGFKGTVDLYRVSIDEKRDIPCWVCRYGSNRVMHIMPVFRKEKPLETGRRYEIQKMKGNELFCYGDSFFRTYTNRAGELCIRSVLIFPDENLVRAACMAKGLKIIRITPVKVLEAKTRTYLTAAWCVKCWGGDTDYAVTYMDLRDGLVLEGFDLLENAVYQDIEEGESFLVYDTIYKACRNENGEWYITKSFIQLHVGGKN